MACADEDQRDCLEHWTQSQTSDISRFGRREVAHTRIQDTIRERDVYRREQQDWFDQQHFEWAEDGALEDGVNSPADAVALCVDVLILHRIRRAQALCLLREEHGCIGLGDKETEQCAQARKDHHHQEDPAPAKSVARPVG